MKFAHKLKVMFFKFLYFSQVLLAEPFEDGPR